MSKIVITKEYLEQKYLNEKINVREISKISGWSYTYIQVKIRKFGIERPRKYKNLIGQKFNKLLVLSENRIENNKTYWNCVCDCGNEKITHTSLLTQDKCKSCGCSRHDESYNREPNREYAIIKRLYSHMIKKRSKKMNFEYDININEFEKIIKSNCYYCGLENSNFASDRLYSVINGKEYKYNISDIIFRFNGIDRIDSNKGYLMDNVVPCCRYCNSAKNDMSVIDFKKFISRIYKYLNL